LNSPFPPDEEQCSFPLPLVPNLWIGNKLDAKLCLATRGSSLISSGFSFPNGSSQHAVFNGNHEAELLDECVPKLELGNEGMELK